MKNLRVHGEALVEKLRGSVGVSSISGLNRHVRAIAGTSGMSRLVHDRFLACDGQPAVDLATGDVVSGEDLSTVDTLGGASWPEVVEMLDHGEEAVPRWVTIEPPRLGSSISMTRRLAADAVARGFVPIAASLYERLRGTLQNEIKGRSLLLIADDRGQHGRDRHMLVEAAAQSSRPHMLLTIRSGRGRPTVVREARAAYARWSATSPPRVDADAARHLQRAARAEEMVSAGRHAAAERLLRDVACALARRGFGTLSARTLTGLGRLLLERGRAIDAESVFDDAVRATEGADDERLVADARLWQAVARTEAGRLSDAEAICRAVEATELGGVEIVPRARATLARVLIWQGRIDEAVRIDLQPAPALVHAEACTWAPYVSATAVRISLLRGHVFEAGCQARQLLTETADASPLARMIAATAHARVLLAAGDLDLAAQHLQTLLVFTRAHRASIRTARLRLLWFDALVRAGRARDASHELAFLRRVATAAPPLLRQAIHARLRGGAAPIATPPRVIAPLQNTAAHLIELAQGDDDDAGAVRKIIEWLAATLKPSRIELCSSDAGPVSTIVSLGHGLPAHLGARVLEAGIAIDAAGVHGGHELGVPVRLGSRLLGAVIGRWPGDHRPPSEARDLIDLAVRVMAPRLEARLSAAREVASASVAVPELLGSSDAMTDVRKAVVRAAAAPFNVLIEGESGVGKELAARAIHHLSARRERRLCDVNCAALPDDLIESEFFGHARGAFSGAVSDRAGLFEEATGGTLFLDEVADLSARAQVKLLRAVQQQEVRRVGETFTRPIDVRLVCAANRDLREEADAGRFRQDLLYRLDVIRVRIPPLRERPQDVAVLVHRLWPAAAARVGTSAVLPHGVLATLSQYHWPGNVRELQNVLAAMAVAAPARGRVPHSVLPGAISTSTPVGSPRLSEARDQFERRFVEVALARSGGRRARAARDLGLSRQGLAKLMARLRMDAT